ISALRFLPALWTAVGGFRGILVASVVLAGAAAYDRLIDDPSVVRQARAGFVVEAERDALLALVEEQKRRAAAAEAALAGLQYELGQQRANSAAVAEQLEREIDEYEAQLAAEGRVCTLNDEDIKW